MTKEELEKEAEEYYEDETEGTFQICEDCHWFADAVQTTYVDSAKPREKQIAELKKENAELKKKHKQEILDLVLSNSSERAKLEEENAELKKEVEKHKWNDILLEDCAGYDKKIAEEYTTLQERIKQLEKENAELRKDKKELCHSISEGGKACVYLNEQLTKAKEIIKKIEKIFYSGEEALKRLSKISDILAEAEQFLKSEVK